jgi:hypothetical protein
MKNKIAQDTGTLHNQYEGLSDVVAVPFLHITLWWQA